MKSEQKIRDKIEYYEERAEKSDTKELIVAYELQAEALEWALKDDTDDSTITMTQNADEAVDNIVEDIKMRKGIGDEWERIDPDIRKDIKERWASMIADDTDD